MSAAFAPLADVHSAAQTSKMDVQQTRPFDSDELSFLELVAEELSAKDGERLRQDAKAARVQLNGDFLDVELPGYQRPDVRDVVWLPIEGEMNDTKGGTMSVLVNLDVNDRLLAVEFIWWENSVAVAPDWSTLKVS